eukprot:TRINITY_DN12914_c0_g1_i1.p1 TRINITY_DN12914_c0_g1~~TRINITY_DN12914_c0_g1_i1.p1  ORF type:complete len:337 (+),score=31.08 TRINITY_DN12914_c0_g1_i1:125-1135(+)
MLGESTRQPPRMLDVWNIMQRSGNPGDSSLDTLLETNRGPMCVSQLRTAAAMILGVSPCDVALSYGGRPLLDSMFVTHCCFEGLGVDEVSRNVTEDEVASEVDDMVSVAPHLPPHCRTEILEQRTVISLQKDAQVSVRVRLRGGGPPWFKLSMSGFLMYGICWITFPYFSAFRLAQNDYHMHAYEYPSQNQLFDLGGGRRMRSTPYGVALRTTAAHSSFQMARRLENARWVSPRGVHEDVILMPDGETPAYYPELRGPQIWDAFVFQQGCVKDPVKYWDSKFFNNSMSSWQHNYMRITPPVQQRLRELALEDELNWLRDPERKRSFKVRLPDAAAA